jgi:predicted Zn-dependent protease
MLDVFETLHRVGEAQGGGGTPGWLATHPAPEDRFDRIAAQIQSDPAVTGGTVVERDEYLQHVDRLVYGQDPRNGYFQNGTFLHPALRFSIQFPGNWQTQNMAQAVLAGSPQQDALIQLTLSGSSSSGAALNEFGSQQGVQIGGGSQTSVNGLPASVAPFQANTDQGTLRGIAAFIEYGGNVFQVLAYSTASGYASYESAFDRTISSFDRLTDAAALNVEPRRLDIVRVSSPMSIDEFAQRNQTSLDVQTLALINGVNPGESLNAGLWKRVVGRALTGN